MKNYRDFPIYFLIIGFLLNIIMYFYHKVDFIELMIRSIILIILFSLIGYIAAIAFENAANAAAKQKSKKKKAEMPDQTSKIDIRVEADDDELLRTLTKSEDEFVEIGVENFKKFMDHD